MATNQTNLQPESLGDVGQETCLEGPGWRACGGPAGQPLARPVHMQPHSSAVRTVHRRKWLCSHLVISSSLVIIFSYAWRSRTEQLGFVRSAEVHPTSGSARSRSCVTFNFQNSCKHSESVESPNGAVSTSHATGEPRVRVIRLKQFILLGTSAAAACRQCRCHASWDPIGGQWLGFRRKRLRNPIISATKLSCRIL